MLQLLHNYFQIRGDARSRSAAAEDAVAELGDTLDDARRRAARIARHPAAPLAALAGGFGLARLVRPPAGGTLLPAALTAFRLGSTVAGIGGMASSALPAETPPPPPR